MTAKKWRVYRDLVIVSFALSMASVEILFLGARTGSLTFLGGLLLSPIPLHFDEARRKDRP